MIKKVRNTGRSPKPARWIPILVMAACVILIPWGRTESWKCIQVYGAELTVTEDGGVLPEGIFNRRNAGKKNPECGILLQHWISDVRGQLEWAGMTERYLARMGLHEKVCQMMFVDLENLVRSHDVTKMDKELKTALREYPVGGIMLKSKNIQSEKQLKKLLKKLQDNSGIPLFLAVDEEGGTVSRVMKKLGNIDGGDIGSMYDYRNLGGDTAYENARQIGDNLSYYGFNLDFAPVADVWSNPKNTVIGKRAYSNLYSEAAELIPYAVRGFHAGGVLCTLKHFPGHGNTKEDSHYGNAYVYETKDDLENNEFQSFRAGIDAGADFVMVGHMIVTDISNIPSDLSKEIVTDILRTELDFSGVIITDSLQMESITDTYSAGDAAIYAVAAGNDMILEPENLEQAVEGIKQAVKDQIIAETQINESVRRILVMKHAVIEKK